MRHNLLVIYDLRFTIWEIPALARELGEAGAEGCPGVTIGGGYKGAGAARRPTMYDVGCAIYDRKVRAPFSLFPHDRPPRTF